MVKAVVRVKAGSPGNSGVVDGSLTWESETSRMRPSCKAGGAAAAGSAARDAATAPSVPAAVERIIRRLSTVSTHLGRDRLGGAARLRTVGLRRPRRQYRLLEVGHRVEAGQFAGGQAECARRDVL